MCRSDAALGAQRCYAVSGSAIADAATHCARGRGGGCTSQETLRLRYLDPTPYTLHPTPYTLGPTP
eukprot:3941588-Rhodomonas_salina.2